MIYNNNWLIDKYRAGEDLAYIFFWGHRAARDGSVSKSCFSQWWVAPFEVDGLVFRTAEHWMMYQKAELFGDSAIAALIPGAQEPNEVKQPGRKIAGFDEQRWNAAKLNIVTEGNQHKFSQHPELKNFILSTGNKILVEASPVDAIWGIGMAEDDKDINNPEQWKGENLLGYALMQVRDLLR